MNDAISRPGFARALVTGGNGFVASRLARYLVRGGVETSVLVRQGSRLNQLGDAAGAVTILRGDGTTDGLREQLLRARPKIVFHLAATYVAAHQAADIDRLVDDNVLLTTRICEAAMEAGSTALLHAGSVWQNAGSAPHDPVPAPNSLYAATKQAADDIIGAFAAMGAFRAATLKIYDSYGPGDPRRKFLNVLAAAADAGEAMPANPGGQMLHLVHVDDIAAAFVHAANLLVEGSLTGHRSFTLPSPRALTLRALVEAWRRATGRAVDVDWGALPYRPGEVMTPWEGPVLPGWSPSISLDEGLRAVYGRD